MKIKMMTLCAGPAGVMEAGHVYDVEPALAKSLVDGHYAQRVVEKAAAIAAESEAPETASLVVEALETEALPAPLADKPRRGKRTA